MTRPSQSNSMVLPDQGSPLKGHVLQELPVCLAVTADLGSTATFPCVLLRSVMTYPLVPKRLTHGGLQHLAILGKISMGYLPPKGHLPRGSMAVQG